MTKKSHFPSETVSKFELFFVFYSFKLSDDCHVRRLKNLRLNINHPSFFLEKLIRSFWINFSRRAVKHLRSSARKLTPQLCSCVAIYADMKVAVCLHSLNEFAPVALLLTAVCKRVCATFCAHFDKFNH